MIRIMALVQHNNVRAVNTRFDIQMKSIVSDSATALMTCSKYNNKCFSCIV